MNIIDPSTTHISKEAVFGENVTIHPNVVIQGKTMIGDNTIIDSNTIIKSSVIGKNNYIISSVIESGNKIGDYNNIGPFSHLRENNEIGNFNMIGSYVEIKNSKIGSFNNMKHLAYIGDVKVGNHVNFGAGVVFANYNSKKDTKNISIVLDFSSIGSNSTIISPVCIGSNSLIGAGSTVTKNIDSDSLYINRGIEIYKKDYYKKDDLEDVI